MRGFVVDSSVFASVVVKDTFFDRAKMFLASHAGMCLATLDLAILETCNTVWKHTFVLKRIPVGIYPRLVALAVELVTKSCSIHRATDLVPRACSVAGELGVTVYDALFIELAKELGYALATFDRKLAAKARGVIEVVEP